MPRKATGTVVYVATNSRTRGHYKARITLPDGHRKWKHFDPCAQSASNEAKARVRAEQFAQHVVAHPDKYTKREPKPARETVEEYAERWLADRERRGLARVSNDRSRLRTHAFPLIGAKQICGIEAAHIRTVIARLDERIATGALAWRTARNVWVLVGKMFKDASRSKVEALRVRETNPCVDVEGPDRGAVKGKQWVYPVEFVELACCEAVPLWWREVYAVTTYLYLRAGEVAALDWKDVHLNLGYVNVRRSVDQRTGKFKPTKSKASRKVSIPTTLHPVLGAMRASSNGSGLVIGPGPASSQHPAHNLPEKCGEPLRKHLRAAGVDRIDLHRTTDTTKRLTFHDLRSTGITWEALAGTEPLKIKQRAGHGQLVTTEGYIRTAEEVGHQVGQPFPELPTSMTGERAVHGGGDDGGGSGESSPESSDLNGRNGKPQTANPQGLVNLGDSWLRGQDSNLRPSGYENAAGVALERDGTGICVKSDPQHVPTTTNEPSGTIPGTIERTERRVARYHAEVVVTGKVPDRAGALWSALGDALDSCDLEEARALYALLARRAELVAG